ncbi:MAG TPA: hypothetical protein VIH35_03155, partial [Kiritimatiellia bacterium]
ILVPLFFAGCASPGLDNDAVVGTWASARQLSLRLRSNGRGYANFADRGAAFVDWTLDGQKLRLNFSPEGIASPMVGQVFTKSDEMVLIEPDHEPLLLERIDTDEPPDLDKRLGIVPTSSVSRAASGKSRPPPTSHR